MIEPSLHVTELTRDPKLRQLVERLEKEDQLFKYNVPANIKDRYENERFFEYLKATYQQPVFVVENPDDIDDFADIGDRVVKKGAFDQKVLKLATGTLGEVINPGNYRSLFRFQKYGEMYLDDETQLRIYGKKRTFRNDLSYVVEKTLREEPLEKWHKVRYVGPDIIQSYDSVPDGAQGIIVNCLQKKDAFDEYHIVWANQPGLQQSRCWRVFGSHFYTRPAKLWLPNEFKLVVPNTINFEKIREEVFTE